MEIQNFKLSYNTLKIKNKIKHFLLFLNNIFSHKNKLNAIYYYLFFFLCSFTRLKHWPGYKFSDNPSIPHLHKLNNATVAFLNGLVGGLVHKIIVILYLIINNNIKNIYCWHVTILSPASCSRLTYWIINTYSIYYGHYIIIKL